MTGAKRVNVKMRKGGQALIEHMRKIIALSDLKGELPKEYRTMDEKGMSIFIRYQINTVPDHNYDLHYSKSPKTQITNVLLTECVKNKCDLKLGFRKVSRKGRNPRSAWWSIEISPTWSNIVTITHLWYKPGYSFQTTIDRTIQFWCKHENTFDCFVFKT